MEISFAHTIIGGIAPLMLALIPEGDPQPTPEQLEMANKEFNSTQDPLALAALIRNFVPSPTAAQIRSNKIPVLALIGDKDPGKKDVDRLDGLMPNLKIVVIPNADHMTAAADPLSARVLVSSSQRIRHQNREIQVR